MRKIFSLVSLLAVTISLSSCGFAIVGPGEKAVRVTMGQIDRDSKGEPVTLGSGLQLSTPLISGFHTISIKQETVDGSCEPLTADQQPIKVSYKVLYRIPEDKVAVLFTKYSGDPYQSLVDPQVQEAFRQTISQYKSDAVSKSVDAVKNDILKQVRAALNGLVEVSDIPITHISLPQVLQDAIAQKQVMEQQSLQKQYELDKANKQAQITVTNAKAEAEAMTVKTEALAKNPALIEYTKAEKWDGKMPQFMTSGAGTFFNLSVPQK